MSRKVVRRNSFFSDSDEDSDGKIVQQLVIPEVIPRSDADRLQEIYSELVDLVKEGDKSCLQPEVLNEGLEELDLPPKDGELSVFTDFLAQGMNGSLPALDEFMTSVETAVSGKQAVPQAPAQLSSAQAPARSDLGRKANPSDSGGAGKAPAHATAAPANAGQLRSAAASQAILSTASAGVGTGAGQESSLVQTSAPSRTGREHTQGQGGPTAELTEVALQDAHGPQREQRERWGSDIISPEPSPAPTSMVASPSVASSPLSPSSPDPFMSPQIRHGGSLPAFGPTRSANMQTPILVEPERPDESERPEHPRSGLQWPQAPSGQIDADVAIAVSSPRSAASPEPHGALSPGTNMAALLRLSSQQAPASRPYQFLVDEFEGAAMAPEQDDEELAALAEWRTSVPCGTEPLPELCGVLQEAEELLQRIQRLSSHVPAGSCRRALGALSTHLGESLGRSKQLADRGLERVQGLDREAKKQRDAALKSGRASREKEEELEDIMNKMAVAHFARRLHLAASDSRRSWAKVVDH